MESAPAPVATRDVLPTLPAPRPSSTTSWQPRGRVRPWRYLVLHHTATDVGSVASIHAEHRQRRDGRGNRWLGIGYHFVVGNGRGMRDGEVQPTFRWVQQLHGAHAGGANRDYNQVGIGIALVGNFDHRPPTPRQLAAVQRLIDDLRRQHGISSIGVIAHRDIRQTSCPGRLFPLSKLVLGPRRRSDFASLPASGPTVTSSLEPEFPDHLF